MESDSDHAEWSRDAFLCLDGLDGLEEASESELEEDVMDNSAFVRFLVNCYLFVPK